MIRVMLTRVLAATDEVKLALTALALVPVSAGGAWLAGNSMIVAFAAALAFALLGVFGARFGGSQGRILVVLGLVGQAMSLTGALAGHPWQLDSHMLFFAILAICMVLSDPKAVLWAAGVIVLHHLSLSVLMPALVYPSANILISVERTLIHGAIVAMETAVIWQALRKRNAAFAVQVAAQEQIAAGAEATHAALAEAQEARAAQEAALEDAQEARSAAETARAAAEAETCRAQEADRNARETEATERAKRAEIEEAQARVVDALRAALKMLASGDLSEPIEEVFPSQYEDLRYDFNAALEAMNRAMRQVRANALTMVDGIATIRQSADGLATRTEGQAATLEETATAIAEIANAAKSTASSAREASQAVGAAKARANASAETVENAVVSMSEIEQSSTQIAKIVELIESIAFQTNLLALNAGVEAARAGEAGRGFSVVASEVRGLALRSSEAAKEIAALIDTSGRQITTGVGLVRETGAALHSIVGAVDDISAHVTSIASSSEEQSHAVSETDHAMRGLERATQENATMFKETTDVTQMLEEQATQLKVAMAAFVILDADRSEPQRGVG